MMGQLPDAGMKFPNSMGEGSEFDSHCCPPIPLPTRCFVSIIHSLLKQSQEHEMNETVKMSISVTLHTGGDPVTTTYEPSVRQQELVAELLASYVREGKCFTVRQTQY